TPDQRVSLIPRVRRVLLPSAPTSAKPVRATTVRDDCSARTSRPRPDQQAPLFLSHLDAGVAPTPAAFPAIAVQSQPPLGTPSQPPHPVRYSDTSFPTARGCKANPVPPRCPFEIPPPLAFDPANANTQNQG